jgi:hypothetical protein
MRGTSPNFLRRLSEADVIGILGEDRSDVEMLRVLLRRLCRNRAISIKGIGFSGLGELLSKGHRQLALLEELGCRWIIVCCDADGPRPEARRRMLQERVLRDAVLPSNTCAVVAVQEVEAWILANLSALSKVFRGWRPKDIINAESISDPKERLIRLSRDERRHARFDSTLHNAAAAEVLDLNTVAQRCPSFRTLVVFARERILRQGPKK